MLHRKWMVTAAASLLAIASLAQELVPQSYPSPDPAARPPSLKQNLRQLFAGTLATVVQGLGAVVTAGIAQRVNGGLVNWFANQGVAPPPGQTFAPGMAPAGMPPPAMYPQQPPMDPQAYNPPLPQPAAQPMYPQPAPGAQPTQPMYAQPSPPPGQPVMSAEPALYAGLAYEVHLQSPSGPLPVDPATHVFTTGDRFVVHYRPTLPGEVEVYNINPQGIERQIDRVAVAAGQLVTLGAYEFRDQKGDEVLRLVMLPCSTDALATTTRDIVRVEGPPPGTGLNLNHCGVATRALRPRTRDIAKVEVDGQTAFALDPVSPQELASGSLAPREIRLTFHHN